MNKFLRYLFVSSFVVFLAAGCDDEDPSIPTVKTESVTPGSTTAEVSGKIVADGGSTITQFGLCFSATTDKPTVENSSGPFYTGVTGAFSMSIPELEPNTVHHVRAYAINKRGVGYGKIITFTTTE
jgi:hypothetical protein